MSEPPTTPPLVTPPPPLGPSYQDAPQPERAAVPPGVNGFAVAALVFGLLGGVFGIIFGITAIRQIGRTGQRGKGLAAAGLVAAVVWAFVGFENVRGTSPDEAAMLESVAGSGLIPAVYLNVKECFTPPPGDVVRGVQLKECGNLHTGEVFGKVPLTGADYPGIDYARSLGEEQCPLLLEKYLDPALDYPSLEMEIRFMYPDEEGWMRHEREVTCLLLSTNGEISGPVSEHGVAYPEPT
jgi:hypothetical protein